jgi:hypothetical protein
MNESDIHILPLKHISCQSDNETLQINWQDPIPGNEISGYIELVKSMINSLSVHNLYLDGSKLSEYSNMLNWKIIEACWQVFYENGGEKIIVINDLTSDRPIEEEYIHTLKENEIPITLEFRNSADEKFQGEEPVHSD